MFYTFLPRLLNMSLTASVAIMAVLLLRLLLKKLPKVLSYALWGIVLFRLLCPVALSSGVSLFGLLDAPAAQSGALSSRMEYIPSDLVHTAYPSVTLPLPGVGAAVNQALPQGGEQLAADPLEAPISIAAYIWLAGALAMGVCTAASCLRLRGKLLTASPLRENIYLADDIGTPFVMGLLRPKIYLPSSLDAREQAYIILHEQYHIRRLDHIMKALAFAALCLHWFNPLVWFAFALAEKDMEMSCDEAVIRRLGDGVRADYAASLLSLSTGRRFGVPLAFGENDTKSRIRNLATRKKTAFWLVLAAATVCIILAAALLTNPGTAIRNPAVQEYTPGAPGIQGSVDKAAFESLSESYAIGTDRNGRAVFKDPFAAFDTMTTQCADGLALMRETFELPPITRRDFDSYKVYGFQAIDGSEQAREQASFVTRFLDIYENSFEESAPAAAPVPSTAEESDALIPGTVYVSYQCIYMNPLSSQFPDADSGFRYRVDDDAFTILHHFSGEPGDPAAREVLRIPVEEWGWRPFPYTDAAWNDLFSSSYAAMNLRETYQEILYQPWMGQDFLMRVDGDIWFVEMEENPQMGTYIWSIYSLVPEEAMGAAEWTYTPGSTFRFALDLPSPSNAKTFTFAAGGLMTGRDGGQGDVSISYESADEIYWSPLNEDGSLAMNASIVVAVQNDGGTVYRGTLYLQSSGAPENPTYRATLIGTGLHLSEDEAQTGGVISAIPGTAG